MGYYANPDTVLKQGRKLESSTYGELIEELNEGELLVGVYDRIIFKNAPHLYSPDEFQEFEKQVNGFSMKRMGFYAVTEDILPDHA